MTKESDKDKVKLTFNGESIGWIQAAFTSFSHSEDDLIVDGKTVDYVDSEILVDNILSENPNPPAAANVCEISFTLDNTFLKSEEKDKQGNMIHLNYIPVNSIMYLNVWKNNFKERSKKELSERLLHNLR